jgi:hypothetical protein
VAVHNPSSPGTTSATGPLSQLQNSGAPAHCSAPAGTATSQDLALPSPPRVAVSLLCCLAIHMLHALTQLHIPAVCIEAAVKTAHLVVLYGRLVLADQPRVPHAQPAQRHRQGQRCSRGADLQAPQDDTSAFLAGRAALVQPPRQHSAPLSQQPFQGWSHGHQRVPTRLCRSAHACQLTAVQTFRLNLDTTALQGVEDETRGTCSAAQEME